MKNRKRRFRRTEKEQSLNIKHHFLILGASSIGPHRESKGASILGTCCTESQTLLLNCLTTTQSFTAQKPQMSLPRKEGTSMFLCYFKKKWFIHVCIFHLFFLATRISFPKRHTVINSPAFSTVCGSSDRVWLHWAL